MPHARRRSRRAGGQPPACAGRCREEQHAARQGAGRGRARAAAGDARPIHGPARGFVPPLRAGLAAPPGTSRRRWRAVARGFGEATSGPAAGRPTPRPARVASVPAGPFMPDRSAASAIADSDCGGGYHFVLGPERLTARGHRAGGRTGGCDAGMGSACIRQPAGAVCGITQGWTAGEPRAFPACEGLKNRLGTKFGLG